MMTKTERWSTPVSGSSDGRSLGKAAVDAAKRFCMIRVPRRAWLVGLRLAAGIVLAGGSAGADAQSRSPNTNVVDELLAELGANPGAIAPSSVPKCSSPASTSSPLVILDNQTFAFCGLSSCFVFNGVAYCKCDVEFGDSISETLTYDTGMDVCTVNAEGVNNGYMVSTFSTPPPNPDLAIYTCPGAKPGKAGSNGAYAQCDGGICFKSTQGKLFPGLETLAEDEIVCSCPITEQSPLNPVGYQISGPYPCQQSYFDNCNKETANSHTGSTLFVGAPTGTFEALSKLLTGSFPPENRCFQKPN
jgi:hypothetical protein